VDPEFAPGHRVSLADGYPLHLAAEESLGALNERLGRKASMLRYRPNLVVSGASPWEEDEWRTVRVGDVIFRFVKPCARCTVITVDQGTGIRGQEPLRSMKGLREWDGRVYFGQNLVFENMGRFRVGDDVHILDRGVRRPPCNPEPAGGSEVAQAGTRKPT
jgi:uncharacterized protein YcbX